MSNWIKVMPGVKNTKKYLICIPFAGGYSTAYRPFRSEIDSEWSIVTLDPPGHGTNKMDLCEDLEELVSLYVKELNEFFLGEFILFGHSMGGRIVHRMTQVLEEKGINPIATFISASLPPTDNKLKTYSFASDDEFIEYMNSLEGLPKEFKEYPELVQYFLPIFKADFKALETHVYPNKKMVNTPLYIFNGSLDKFCQIDHVQAWKEFSKETTFYTINGGHMFLNSHLKEVTNYINKIIYRKSHENA